MVKSSRWLYDREPQISGHTYLVGRFNRAKSERICQVAGSRSDPLFFHGFVERPRHSENGQSASGSGQLRGLVPALSRPFLARLAQFARFSHVPLFGIGLLGSLRPCNAGTLISELQPVATTATATETPSTRTQDELNESGGRAGEQGYLDQPGQHSECGH